MSTPATTLLVALKTHLTMITTANGYRTTVGAVYTGRAALAVGTLITLPVLTLTPTRDDPDGDVAMAANWFQKWKRAVEIEAILPETDNWDSDLDNLFDDLRLALSRFPAPLEIGSVVFYAPANGGDNASLVLPITYRYTTNYADN